MAAVEPFRGVRKMIADRMLASLRTTAQLTYHAALDVSPVAALLAEWKQQARPAGLQDCLLYALARTLAAHPALNGTCDEAGYHLDEAVHFSIALATPAGLVAPVLRHAEAKGLDELASLRRDLAGRAAEGRLGASDFKGGTFTVSNLGLTGIEYFTPILNPPQIAILGLGKLGERLELDSEGRVIGRKTLPLSLTADHRIVDGEPAGRFLADLGQAIRTIDWVRA